MWWVLGGVTGLGLLSWVFRDPIAAEVGVLLDDAQKAIFKAVIPSQAQPYADIILQVAQEQGVSPFIICQIGYRESLWGQSLSPSGPGGTGDSGHGRGLMQIDDRSFTAWLAANDWTDPYTNITKGTLIFKAALNFFASSSQTIPGTTDGTTVLIGQSSSAKRGLPDPGVGQSNMYPDPRPLSGDDLTAAAIAAYNTGIGNVIMSIACGESPDVTTTSPPYSTDVMSRVASLLTSFNSQATS